MEPSNLIEREIDIDVCIAWKEILINVEVFQQDLSVKKKKNIDVEIHFIMQKWLGGEREREREG